MILTFEWLEARCTVDAPPEVADPLALLFHPIVARTGSGTPDLAVRRTGAGYAVTPAPQHPDVADGRVVTVPETISLLEMAVTHHLLGNESQHLHLHAAGAVGPSGGAVLALGTSGRGKSAFAAACLAAGHRLLGDDVVALDGEGRAVALPRPLKVDAVWATTVGVDPTATPARDPTQADVWLVPGLPGASLAAGGWTSARARVERLVDIRFEPGADLHMEPLAPAAVLRLLIDSLHRSGAGAPGVPDALIALADQVPALRLVHGDARAVVRELLGDAGSGR